MNFIPSTEKEQAVMLGFLGKETHDDLFSALPDEIKLGRELDIPHGKSELELLDCFAELGDKNRRYKTILRGYGAYNHFIPSVVKNLASRNEFVTAYTPYQPEMSQGVLRVIFEYQSLICRLTGMDVSNASVYDGASAAAEAVGMCRSKGRDKVIISSAVKKHNAEVIKTYCFAYDVDVVMASEKDGVTDLVELESVVGDDTACVYVESPNANGLLEDCDIIGKIAHSKGVKFIIGAYPVSLGILKSPGEYGADIAVGEAQSLGLPLSFGGAYLGFLAVKKDMMRKIPGRVVGETVDGNGRRAFVLTMQAREQHIRREKASSSICSNEALCALTAAIYLSAVGKQGLHDIALQSMSKAKYFAGKLCGTEKFKLKYDGLFFNEFVTVSDAYSNEEVERILGENNILSGYNLNEREILWCVTEANTKAELDFACELLAEGGAK